jgi:hypothetical protein
LLLLLVCRLLVAALVVAHQLLQRQLHQRIAQVRSQQHQLPLCQQLVKRERCMHTPTLNLHHQIDDVQNSAAHCL